MQSKATQALPLESVVSLVRHPLSDTSYREKCKCEFDEHGVLVLSDFLTSKAVQLVCEEGQDHQDEAFYAVNDHNVYLKPFDTDYAAEHPRNRLVSSSKGCITTDQIPANSALRVLYDNVEFKDFLISVLDEKELHEYVDPLSSINLHYAAAGQELGWHFDNSSFAITLLIQKPESGARFEYVKNVRDADAGHMNYARAGEILDGSVDVQNVDIKAGSLVLFRGRNSMHRVTPTVGEITRMLVVLAYNTEPGIALSESARMTFYGRLG